MSDKKNGEQQFIPSTDSEEWSQVLHGELSASTDNETHKEAELIRHYLIQRDEAKAIINLPEVDVLETMSPDEARVVYQNASKEIHRRGTTMASRLRSLFIPVALGGLSAAVVYLWMEKQQQVAPFADLSGTQSVQTNPINTDGYVPISSGGKPQKYPNMLLMVGGTMKMGCTSGWDDAVGGCRDSEYPAHYVNLKPFEFAQHEVTVGQFKAFAEAASYISSAEIDNKGCVYQDHTLAGHPFIMNPDYNWRNPGFEQDDSHPVVCVSWLDAQAYIQWLNKETGRQYRLPTESEWEFAARGGKSTVYFWGNGESLHLRANHNNSEDGWEFTAPVGSYNANKYSIQDTSGNVWEWVQDCWHSTYVGAPTDGSSWETGCSTSSAVKTRRGGAWDAGAPGIRSAIRSSGAENDRSNLYGFRIAHDYDATKK